MPSPSTAYSRDYVADALVAYFNTLYIALFNDSVGTSIDVDAGFAYGAGIFAANEAEALGGGYTAGGQAITPSVQTATGNVKAFVAAANPAWPITGSFTADLSSALIYNNVAPKPALCVLNFGGTYNVTNGVFTVTLDTSPVNYTFYTQS